MRKIIFLGILFFIYPVYAYADVRINSRIDFSSHTIDARYNTIDLKWKGVEFRLEKDFKKTKLKIISGFSVGMRREPFYTFTGLGNKINVQRWDEGTYMLFGAYRRFYISRGKTLMLNSGINFIYGIPGTTLNRTHQDRYGEGNTYTHIFPIRNANFPIFVSEQTELVGKSGIVYPELSLTIRKLILWDRINIDAIGGIRLIRFGIVESSPAGSFSSVNRLAIPSLGVGVGFKF